MVTVSELNGVDGEPVSAHFLHRFSQMRGLIGSLLEEFCHPQEELFDEDPPMVDVG